MNILDYRFKIGKYANKTAREKFMMLIPMGKTLMSVGNGPTRYITMDMEDSE